MGQQAQRTSECAGILLFAVRLPCQQIAVLAVENAADLVQRFQPDSLDLAVFSRDRFCSVIPTCSASSFERIFLLANMTSRLTIIATLFSHERKLFFIQPQRFQKYPAKYRDCAAYDQRAHRLAIDAIIKDKQHFSSAVNTITCSRPANDGNNTSTISKMPMICNSTILLRCHTLPRKN